MFAVFSSRSPTGSFLGALDSNNEVDSDSIMGISIEDSSSLSNSEKYELVINILRLKKLNPGTDKLQFAERVSQIDEAVKILDEDEVNEEWELLISSIADEDKYYDLIKVVLDKGFPNNKKENLVSRLFTQGEDTHVLLKHIIDMKYSPDDVLKSSKSLIEGNKIIQKLESTEISDLWNQLINCNLKCDLYDDLILKICKYSLDNF